MTRPSRPRRLLAELLGSAFLAPFIPGKRYLDWDVPDPAGQPITQIRGTRDEIARRVHALTAELDGSPSG